MEFNVVKKNMWRCYCFFLLCCCQMAVGDELQCGDYDMATPLAVDDQPFTGVKPERQCSSDGAAYYALGRMYWHIHEIDDKLEARIRMVPKNSMTPCCVIDETLTLYTRPISQKKDQAERNRASICS
jgi:hypothetical protein